MGNALSCPEKGEIAVSAKAGFENAMGAIQNDEEHTQAPFNAFGQAQPRFHR